jgi:hypothetical protein
MCSAQRYDACDAIGEPFRERECNHAAVRRASDGVKPVDAK